MSSIMQLDLLREPTKFTKRYDVPAAPLVDVPRAANADPDTSHLAAARIKASGALGEQQRRVLEMVCKFPGCTSAELAAHIDATNWQSHRAMTGRRLPELERGGFVRKGEARVCRVCKAKCVTWWPKQSTGSER